jgi:hypothetical protein
MKNIKYYIGLVMVLVLVFTSCQEEEATFGDIITPSDVTISAEIVGVDADNPNGDGSGFVNFIATANNEISYKFDFGNGKSEVAPNGVVTHRYTTTGTNTYTVVVNAIGTGGVKSSTSVDIEIFSSFSDVEAVEMMSGSVVGESKTWYWASDKASFVALGPVTDGTMNEFAYGFWWSDIAPWDEAKSCMYTNEFVFTRLEEGLTFEQTVGPAFIPGTHAETLGVEGDICHDETVATTMFGLKNVSFLPSSSKAALEGTYGEDAQGQPRPYRGTSFEISDGGFMGWFVGASTYDIIKVTDDELVVRIIEDGDDYAWYHTFTSTKPVQGTVVTSYTYNDLVWEDDFNTDGAPDPANWTYDLGRGSNGWGNGESQSYTDNADNVKVEDGSLKITAKADGSGSYTSARLKTQGLYKFKYGRVEVKAKLPAAQGTWPAIWMLGSNITTVSWPHCGEIDIMEQTGDNKDISLGTCHWFDTASSSNASYGETKAVTNASSEFHLYTMEWTDTAIKIYLDDVKFYELTNSTDLPFNADFFLILNVAMGGNLGGDIDPAFTEDTMEIDYVKVFQ